MRILMVMQRIATNLVKHRGRPKLRQPKLKMIIRTGTLSSENGLRCIALRARTHPAHPWAENLRSDPLRHSQPHAPRELMKQGPCRDMCTDQNEWKTHFGA